MSALPDLRNPENRTLGRILLHHAETRGDRPFLLVDGTSYSFAEINTRANAVAAGLRSAGIERGERILMFMDGCVDFVVLAFAANKCGVVWVPINTDYKGEWLREAVQGSRAALIVTDATHFARLSEALDGQQQVPIYVRGTTATLAGALRPFADLELRSAPEPEQSLITYGDTSAILWTSGTTGNSKGVMQSHNVWIRAAESGNRGMQTHDGDIAYNCLPLYNSAAWAANIYRALLAGIPCALDLRFSVRDFWDRIRFYGATQTLTLGVMHMFLWNQPERDDDADNPLRVANMVPMPEHLIAPFCRRFGLEAIFQGYAQSEVLNLLVRQDRPGIRRKPNALGEVADDIELRLLDDTGNEVAAGQVGEFCVKPLQAHVIFNGYFDNPQATAAAYHGVWYRSGDLGMRDDDGEFFFVDRKKDYIRHKGRNISSLQVEAVALRHTAVAAAAVYGVAARELESEAEIKLDVIAKPEAVIDPEELARFINTNAPYFFVPRYIEVVDSLPYTPTNKIQKYRLRERGVSAASWDRERSGMVIDR